MSLRAVFFGFWFASLACAQSTVVISEFLASNS